MPANGSVARVSDYIPRLIDSQLESVLRGLPAVALNGPKGVGKTASAERIATTVMRLDNRVEQQLLDANPERFRASTPPVLLDEWQRAPEIWDGVRRWVDDGAPVGSAILTGSAAPRGIALHSGAGRIASLRMRPLSLAERNLDKAAVSLDALLRSRGTVDSETSVALEDYVREITASGFPGIRNLTQHGRVSQLDSYIDHVIRREFADQGLAIRAPETLRRWLRAYAAAGGTVTSYAKILDAATPGETNKPAKTTTIAYRDVLHSLWLLDHVEAWAPGVVDLGRLGQVPKHFLADPALACRLLEVDADELFDATLNQDPLFAALGTGHGTVLGRLFESLVALSLQTYAAHIGARIGHLRTRNGDHEVDFILHRGRRTVAIEVKLAASVTDEDVRHLRWLSERMGPHLTDAIIITTGTTAYRRKDGIAVVPAALLGP